jgi:hypothetical protein
VREQHSVNGVLVKNDPIAEIKCVDREGSPRPFARVTWWTLPARIPPASATRESVSLQIFPESLPIPVLPQSSTFDRHLSGRRVGRNTLFRGI